MGYIDEIKAMQDKANAKQSECKTKLIQDKANLGHIDESSNYR